MTAPTDLPAPLVPHDIDIAGLPAFMLDVERLFASELWAISTGEEFKAAVALWGRAWQQSPAGSLPNDERLLAAFSGAGPRWRKVREMALRGFILCSDNRLYHRVLCADVLRAAKHKDQRRERTAAATKARLAKGDNEPTPPPKGKKLNGNNETAPRNVERHEARNVERDDQRNEVRHEQRHDAAMMTLRPTLRSPIDRTGQDSSKNNTGGGSDPVSREPPRGADWATKENFDRVERRCRAALPAAWVNDPVVSPMARLEADGLDLETEIVPTILDLVAARRNPIRTWAILANAVAERVAVQRQARTAQGLAATPKAAPKPEDMVDLGAPYGPYGEAVLRVFIAKHRESGQWLDHMVGPPPGQPGCRIPARLLIGEAA